MNRKTEINCYFVVMNIEAIKYHLIERVMRLSEGELENIEKFLERESELSKSLDRAMQQVKEGKVTPHSEVKKKYEKWL
jgi:predicted transcriptional regulator